MIEFLRLQNGSDIRGIALEGVPDEKVNLTTEAVRILGRAFVIWLNAKGIENPVIAIGRDSRLSGEKLMAEFVEGAYVDSVKIYDAGICSTPAMFMATIFEPNPVDAGVMITASHLPFNRNGFKFFTKEGGLNKADITKILDIASKIEVRKPSERKPEKIELLTRYTEFLIEYIRKSAGLGEKPLANMRIAVDAGNGAGGFFAEKVLVPLGADVTGSQFLEPDGHFPNHIPNPEDKVAMASICEAVCKSKADMGVIFDTDVDRAAVVDSEGHSINRNHLIALISTIVLREHPGSTIVTDSITSDGLKEFIEKKLGGIHHRYKRGYKNVINESIRINKDGGDSWLAIETSGHAALRENYFLDDGAFLVAKILVEAAKLHQEGKNISDLIKDLKQPKESKEYRYKIKLDHFQAFGNMILSGIQFNIDTYEGWKLVSPNFEGVRVKCTDPKESGWFLMRMSLHDPVLPLNIESDVEGGVEAIYERIKKILAPYMKNLEC